MLLLQGNIGKPGARVCPVRGHSNGQGDRTMGIFEKMPEAFHDRLDQEFKFDSPRKHGDDTVAAIRAMRGGKVRVFLGMVGNFVRVAPDSIQKWPSCATLPMSFSPTLTISRCPTRLKLPGPSDAALT